METLYHRSPPPRSGARVSHPPKLPPRPQAVRVRRQRPRIWPWLLAIIVIGVFITTNMAVAAIAKMFAMPPMHVQITQLPPSNSPTTLPDSSLRSELIRDWYFHHSVVFDWFPLDFGRIANDRKMQNHQALERDCTILDEHVADFGSVMPMPLPEASDHMQKAIGFYTKASAPCHAAAATMDEQQFFSVQEYLNLAGHEMHIADQVITPYYNGDR